MLKPPSSANWRARLVLLGLELALVLLLLLCAALAHAALTVLDDGALAAVQGQTGIAVGIDFRFNTNASGNVIGTGCGLASPNFTDNVSEACRLAISFNNRTNEWLVLKDYYGVLSIPEMYLDASCTSGTLAGGICSGGSATTHYDNPDRFEDEAGTCLLNGNAGGCVSGDASNRPALLFSVAGNASTFESDVLWSFNASGVAMESGASGYNADQYGSFLGIRLSDTAQPQARVDIDGRIKLIGF